MTAISLPSQSQSQSIAAGAAIAPEPGDAEIDASCRLPVMLLFLNAAGWLFIGSLVGLIATLKFHQPNILAGCSWFTYGRLHPAHLNALIYGFGVPAGLGVMLWILSQSGRVRLALSPVALIGALVWNAGVTLGLWGILYGDSTGFEWLEMPRYASLPMFFGYVLIGVSAMVTLNQRRDSRLQLAQWFILAALLWFPWIYASANFLLVAVPVRGVVQPIIDSWYTNNLRTIWFGFVGIATLFYLIPQLINNRLHSRYLGAFLFWTLLFFGTWTAVAPGSPMPAWVPAVSTVGSVLLAIPTIAFAINLKRTMECHAHKTKESLPFRFLFSAPPAYLLSGIAVAVTALGPVSEITHFTWFEPALTQLFFYGFFTMTIMGAIYHIAPRLTGVQLKSPRLAGLNYGLAFGGIVIYALTLGVGGIIQGRAFNDISVPLQRATSSWIGFFRASTLGELMMVVANLLLLINLAIMAYYSISAWVKAELAAGKISGRAR